MKAKVERDTYLEFQLQIRPRIKIEDALTDYIYKYVKNLKSPVAVGHRIKHYKYFFVDMQKLVYWDEIDDDMLLKFVQFRKEFFPVNDHKTRHTTYTQNYKRHISDVTIHKELHTLNHLNRAWIIKKWKKRGADFTIEDIAVNLRKSRDMTNFIGSEEWGALLNELPDFLVWPFRYFFATGLRAKDVFKLRTTQIKWHLGRTVFIPKSTKGNERELYVEHTEEILWIYSMCGITPNTKEERYVFLQPDGMPLRDHRKVIDKAMEKAGINRLKGQRLHLLRHTAATNKYKETKDILEVKEHLGHSSSKTSEKYMHLAKSLERVKQANKTPERHQLENCSKKEEESN